MCVFVCIVPEEFMYNPVSRSYGEPHKRPEVQNATIEFIAPSEYMVCWNRVMIKDLVFPTALITTEKSTTQFCGQGFKGTCVKISARNMGGKELDSCFLSSFGFPGVQFSRLPKDMERLPLNVSALSLVSPSWGHHSLLFTSSCLTCPIMPWRRDTWMCSASRCWTTLIRTCFALPVVIDV